MPNICMHYRTGDGRSSAAHAMSHEDELLPSLPPRVQEVLGNARLLDGECGPTEGSPPDSRILAQTGMGAHTEAPSCTCIVGRAARVASVGAV